MKAEKEPPAGTVTRPFTTEELPETERRESERLFKVNIEVPSAKEVKTHEKPTPRQQTKQILFFHTFTPLKIKGTG